MNEVIHIVSKEKDYWKKEEVERDGCMRIPWS